MLRLVTAIILLVSLMTANLCYGADYAATAPAGAEVCSACHAGGGTQDHQCPAENGSSHSEHCCDTHGHPQAVTAQIAAFVHPVQIANFSPIVPHLVPQDFSRIPFIPPRHTA